MNVAAIIISIFAALFAGILAILAYREQRLRLRPQVYIDRIDTNVSPDALTFRFAIQNVGLLLAKNVTISPVLKVDNIKKQLGEYDIRSKAIILPNQILWNTMSVGGETANSILQGSVKLYAEIRIEYESKSKKYYYQAHYGFNSIQKNWDILDGDAN